MSASAVSSLPDGDVRVFADYTGDVREDVDVAVVGSGPTGSLVAYELARAGRRVALLEEGPPFTPADFVWNGGISMARTMYEGGLRATRGTVMPTMQARALGGGSLVNSAICVRPPAAVLDRWCSRFDLERTRRSDLDPHYDAVAKLMGIATTPHEVLGRRNLVFKRGCDVLGYPSEPIPRNVRGCRGSGECFTGCRSRAKQSADVALVPQAVRHGARVLSSVQVQRILTEGSRVAGVEGRVVEPFTGRAHHRVRVDARVVVLAAGCMITPVLLQRSGDLANRSGQVGRNLQFHPGVAIAGVFPERIDPQFGATQGYQSLHFLGEGFKLETLWAPPSVLAVRTPGFGHELKRRYAEFPYTAIFDAIVSANRSLGTVRPRRGAAPAPRLHWRLHPHDMAIAVRALWVMAEIFFAAGARKILPGIHGIPDELHSLEEARVMRRRRIRPSDIVFGGNHAFCTTRMHGDPRRGVVDEWGRCHDLENLYVADTGIFPQCPGVNPMFTAMALAHRLAGALAERT